MLRYNNERPHDSLNDMTPVEFLQANNQPGNSNPAWNLLGEVYTTIELHPLSYVSNNVPTVLNEPNGP
jgi:hypothetical protein